MSEKKQERGAGTGVRFLAALGLIVTTMVWGGSFVAMKTSVEQVPPTWLLAIRFTLTAVVMGHFVYKTDPQRVPRRVGRRRDCRRVHGAGLSVPDLRIKIYNRQ